LSIVTYCLMTSAKSLKSGNSVLDVEVAIENL